MAVVAVKSTQITNADASPRTPNNPVVAGGPVLEFAALVEGASGDSAASVYRMFRIRSSDRVSALYLLNDAIATTGAADIGLYLPAGGAVVDADLFASAVSLTSARTAETDLTYEATATNIDKVEKRVWELLGLSADPGLDYDVALTLTTGLGGAGTLALKGRIVR